MWELADGTWRERIEPVLYRPFDLRVTVYDRNVAVHRRERVMRHMLAGPNVGLATARATEIARGWEHVFVSKSLIQHHTVSLKEVNYLFPLYTYPAEGQEDLGLAREPNLGKGLVDAIRCSLGLEFIPDGSGDLQESFGPDDVLNYIYAVLHSPQYRRRYADFLKSDFPRVPLPGNRALFVDLVPPGARLTSLHLMEGEGTNKQASLSNTRVEALAWTRFVTRRRAAECPGAYGSTANGTSRALYLKFGISLSAATALPRNGLRTERAEFCPMMISTTTERSSPHFLTLSA